MSALINALALAAILPSVAYAASPVYGQCGGINWTGDTTCVSGSTCTVVNDYYYQCLPGTGSTVTTSQGVSTSVTVSSTTAPPSTTAVPADNPYNGYEVYLSPYYAQEVVAAAAAMTDSTLAAKALKVKDIPTFIWFDVVAKVPDLGTYLADATALAASSGKKYLLQIVVYDLPDRDCAALASNGEFSIANDGLNKYKNYIDQIVAQVAKYPNIRVVAVVEPDSLANLVTNLNVSKCNGAQTAYKEGVIYAMQKLSTVGVYMYLDAGHAGWLGWQANLSPAAQLFNDLYVAAGSPQFVRGLATNVANYNSLSTSSPDPITQGNANYDEIHYINAIAPLLTRFPAKFIVDQGRSGVQNIRQAWGNWCNVIGAGFGMRPTLSTGSSLIDAVVWVKPGGECDGTSNTSSVRYDGFCGKPDAMQNAPEAGTWFQAYFEGLVAAANPAL